MSDATQLVGDVRSLLPTLPAESVDCVITSPPYWGLRDYGVDRQLGLEPTPDEYVANMAAVFREVRRVLAPHGTLWLNLGDSYASSPKGNPDALSAGLTNNGRNAQQANAHRTQSTVAGLKPKDLVGVPWRVAFALQADGWYLRSDIIWAKPNPMPESVRDRPTKSHEYVFLMSKGPRYWFDQGAVREPNSSPEQAAHNARYAKTYDAHTERVASGQGIQPGNVNNLGIHARGGATVGRNIRSVWKIATQPYKGAHFATFPEELVRRCLLAGCPARVCRVCGKPSERIVERLPTGFDGAKYGERAVDATGGAKSGGTARSTLGSGGGKLTAGHETVGWSDCGHDAWRPGVVLDPFGGSGTTALVADKHQRHAILVELNPEYAKQAADRLERPQATLF